MSRILGQRLADDVHVGRRQHAQIGRRGQMLHQNLAGALPIERHAAGQHLVQDDSRGIDVDLFVVVAGGDLGGHVVDGADALSLGRALTAADELAQSVVADFHRSILDKDVSRLEIAVDDAVVMQARHRLG